VESRCYVDPAGRNWLVRELVEYDTHRTGHDGFPLVVRSALVFESDGERRFADDVPVDWWTYEESLAEQFARAARLPQS
jgi:hypothetical protein